MNDILSASLTIAAIPAIASTGYLALLALAARRSQPPAPTSCLRYAIIVPAHDEAAGIVATVRSLLAMQYPPDQYRVVVVADNCTDTTAVLARAAGARVLERYNAEKRGKGYALMFAYNAIIEEGWAEAVVVIDADTIVSSNLLGAVDARLSAGSECAQAEYGVRNGADSWRTRLMSLAFALHHTVRSLGRARLGLSCGLRGNGMAFTVALLRRVPHESAALVEDVEYGIVLGMADVPVTYIAEATVLGEMPATEQASRTQRDRWERGRRILVRTWTWPLLRAAVRRGGGVCRDLAADLLLPPLITVATIVALGCGAAILAAGAGLVGPTAPMLWLISLGLLLIYVGRGCAFSSAGWRVLADFIWIPVYAVWKISVRFRSRSSDAWVRTARDATAADQVRVED
ncbi:MAG: glycosyltransferase [Phycisphaerae bacterium]|nr:glycosyltransferase [Gemmatimonadaceae bacterium]